MEDRLLKILRHYDLSPSVFADKLGVQRSSISHLLSGRNNPSFDFMLRLTESFTDINLDWFITGKGNMLKKQIQTPVNLSLFDMESNLEKQVDTQSEKPDLKQQKETDYKFTNVNNEIESVRKGVSKIILFYKDKSWEEFVPSDS